MRVADVTEARVCVVGASLIDLISYVPRLPSLGETLHGREFRTGFGGKGANQAVMAARLGARVSMVTRLGRDVFGESMLENFRTAGVDTTHVTFDETAASGVAPIVVDPDGANSIVIVTGANDRLTVDDVERARAAIAAADVLVCQLEIPLEVTAAALRLAREESTRTVLNPAPARAELPASLYRDADVLCLNEPEAELLLGRPVAPGAETAAARALRSRGPASVVLTLGERGCAVAADGVERTVEAARVEVVDTTGAGDAFVGTLAVALAEGGTLVAAAERATAVATLSVRRPGTQASFPTVAELGRD